MEKDESKLTKFALSKYLNISRNRLTTLLKQLPPNKNEFDGKYYIQDYVDKLKETFNNQINIKIDEFKKINKCYTLTELSKEFHIEREKIKDIINNYNLDMIKYGNLEFCSESVKLKLIELINNKEIYSTYKINEDGFVKIIELVKILNLTTNKLLKLTSYYKINVKKINNVLYITKEDFNFIKTLKSEIISKIINPEFLTLSKLCKEFNVSFNTINNAIKSNRLNLKPKKYKNINIYDDESRKILKLYLDKQKELKLKNDTCLLFTNLSKYLKISREKLNNYFQYFKPNSEEFDGKYYTYEFADKMAEFIKNHPSIRQNKVYVRELNNMEFDSKVEAYYYCYMKDHNHEIKHHPLNLYYFDSKGKKRRYEVDFLVDGKLVEIKGDVQFDENGKPFFRGKSWQEKYDCMIKNNVEMILSSEFNENGRYKYMRYYFHEKYSFVKYIKELTEELNKDDIKYISKMKQSVVKNCNIYKCVETSEVHFSFEWESNHIFVRGNANKCAIHGKHYVPLSLSERREYILSKIKELRAKGLDVSWFEENEEKYFLKITYEKQKYITIFDM